MTHCGSEVRVGVKVDVGRGVSEGGAVGVSVGEGVSVSVAGCDSSSTAVTSGDGVMVAVGVVVGIGGAIRLSPPQPRSKKVNPDIQRKSLLTMRAADASTAFATLTPLSARWLSYNG